MSKTIGVALNLKDMFSPALKSAMKTSKLMTDQVKSTNGVFSQLGKTSLFANMNKEGKEATKRLAEIGTKIHETMSLAKKAVIGAGVAIVGVGAKMGFSEAFNLEGYRQQLITATGSTERASELMRNAVELANKTPFEAGPLIDASQRLEMMGISSQKWLNTIADTSGALGKDVIQVSEAIIDANTGEFERLKELGIRKDQVLLESNKKYGEGVVFNTQGQVMDQVKLMDVLQGMMDSRFKGGAEKLAGTTKGLWSTITGITKTSLANIIGIQNDGVIKQGSLLDFVKDKVKMVGDKLQELQNNGALQKIADEFTEKVKAVGESLSKTFNFIKDNKEVIVTIGEIVLAFMAVVKVMLLVDKAFKAWSTTMEMVNLLFVSTPIGWIILLIFALCAAGVLLYKNWDWIKAKLKELWNSIKNTFEWIGNSIKEAWNGAIDATVNFFTWIWNSITDFGSWVINGVASFFSWVWNSIKGFLKWVVEGISNFFTWLIAAIPKFIDSVINWIKDVPNKIAYILGFILGKFTKWSAELSLWIAIEVPKIVKAIIDWFKELPNKIWDWLLATWNKFRQWAIDLTVWASTEISNFIEFLVSWFSQLPGRIWDWLVATWNKFIDWGSNLIDWAGTTMSDFINSIIDWISKLPGMIWDWLVEAANKVSDWGADLIKRGADAAVGLGNSIVGAVSEIPSKMWDIGKNIVEGLWNGISGMAGWLKDKASDFVDSFVQGFKDGLGIHSPSRLFADEVGKFIPMGIEVGFNTEFPNTVNNLKNKTQTLAESTKPNNSIGTSTSKSKAEPNIYIPINFNIQGNMIGNKEYMDETAQYISDTIIKNLNNM